MFNSYLKLPEGMFVVEMVGWKFLKVGCVGLILVPSSQQKNGYIFGNPHLREDRLPGHCGKNHLPFGKRATKYGKSMKITMLNW